MHLNDLILTYTYKKTNVIIDLQLNNHLIPDGHFLTYQGDDGENVVQNLTKIEIDMCHYHVNDFCLSVIAMFYSRCYFFWFVSGRNT